MRDDKRDMSPDAIARRLQMLAELYDLAQLLATAQYLGKVEPARPSKETGSTRDPNADG